MSRLHDYAQLVRLPALPTALADICLGALAAAPCPRHWLPFGLLLVASACLYMGGMVWNDFFDVEQDKRERPFRPIPSGKISRREAGLFGAALLAGGVLAALLAGGVLATQGEGARPLVPGAGRGTGGGHPALRRSSQAHLARPLGHGGLPLPQRPARVQRRRRGARRPGAAPGPGRGPVHRRRDVVRAHRGAG